MKRATRYILLNGGIAAWLIMLTVGTTSAQNFSGVMPVESEAEISASDDESYAGVTLTYTEPDEELAVRDSLRIPEFTEDPSNYTLGKEDVIEITVTRHPEVSGVFIINSEGKIQYEFIGDITVEGMKKDEVKTIVTQRLTEYIISPDVTVQIVGYNSKIVYVIGEVRSPGKIYMRGDTITVREALVQAGLPLLTGKVAHSRLITPSDTGKVERKIVNVHKLLYEGDLRENLIMEPGDTLYVPPTLMAKALRTIQPVSAPIGSAASTGRTVTTGF